MKPKNNTEVRKAYLRFAGYLTCCMDDAEWVKPNGQTALWYYTSCSVRSEKETLVVSMPHPNRAAKCWTLELEKILRETGRS